MLSLTCSLGVPGQFDSRQVQDAIRKICTAAAANNIWIGLGGVERRLDMVIALRKEIPGIQYTMAGRDSFSILKGMRDVVDTLKVLEK